MRMCLRDENIFHVIFTEVKYLLLRKFSGIILESLVWYYNYSLKYNKGFYKNLEVFVENWLNNSFEKLIF